MMQLSEAAKAINAQHIGADAMLTSVDTDSRHVQPGQLFVALKGDKFDGHDFAQQAIQQGAAAILLSSPVADAEPALLVADTYQALGQLAAYWRSKFSMPIAAITGSNGKTTVKEMLASILRVATGHADAVLATQGNLNNHIGLPLTLLKLTAQHRYAVVELGMNHTGEISYITRIAKPTLALINNAGNAHLGELGSFEAIAKAKGEIFEGLAVDGVAVINADDVFAPLWLGLAGARQVITFGLKNKADVSASYQLHASSSDVEMNTPQGAISVSLPAPGLHNVMNALAATSAALAMGVSLKAVTTGLEHYVGAKGRLQYKAGLNGSIVIDDTYNANPMSMKAAIDVLAKCDGEKILILADMGELGTDAVKMHEEVGLYAQQAGIKRLYCYGDMSSHIASAFGAASQHVSGVSVSHYQDLNGLIAYIKPLLNTNFTILIKGSRFMAMERLVNQIVAKDDANINGEAH